LIAQGLPVTATIGIAALLLSVLLGVPCGVIAAARRNGALDHALMSAALVGLAVPGFVVAPLLALIFGIRLGWLPVGGWEVGDWRFAVLPVVTLALPFVAHIARLTRGSMLEVLESPFIRTARAKGLSPARILRVHALPPALMPVLSYLGPAAAAALTGSLVVEQVFGLPASDATSCRARSTATTRSSWAWSSSTRRCCSHSTCSSICSMAASIRASAMATDRRLPRAAGCGTMLVAIAPQSSRHRGGIVQALLVVLALLAPSLSANQLEQVDWSLTRLATPPSLANGHWFGTDSNGRDLFVRVWYGTRVSLLVALLATCVSVAIGVVWGCHRGLRRRPHGRMADAHRRRAVRVAVHVFRDHLTVVFGRSLWLIFIAIGAVGWLTDGRIERGRRWRCASANSWRRPSRSASHNGASSRDTSCPTCSGRSSFTPRSRSRRSSCSRVS
jgi:ABC-type dipeptide/oligopeptide/nickel transport system permease component